MEAPVASGEIGVAVCFATVLSAAQVLPGLELAPLSNRTGGVSYEEAARTSYPPEELLEYIAPGAFGVNLLHRLPTYTGRWGAPMSERIVTDYFGVGALVLAICGIAFSTGKRKWFWAVLPLAGIAIGTGASTGLLKVLRAVLPGFNSFRSPAVAMGWATIGAIVLMSMGLEWLLSPHKQRARWFGMICFVILGLVAASAAYIIDSQSLPGVSPEPLDGAIIRTCGFLIFPLLFAGLMMWVFRAETSERANGEGLPSLMFARIPRRVVLASRAIIWIAFLSLDVGDYSRRFMAPLELSGFFNYLDSATPASVVLDPDHPVRIVHKGNELTNAFMSAGVGSIHGYHPIVYDRYVRAIDRFGFVSRETSKLFHQNWLITPPGQELESKDAWSAAGAMSRGILYRRSQPDPYIQFPENVKIASGRDQAFEALSGEEPFEGNTAIVESETDPPIWQTSAGEPQTQLLRYTSNQVGFKADVGPQPALAVFGDLMAPGWRLWRLGAEGERSEELETYYANGAFRSAVLPAGPSEYIWKYEPMSFRLGLFASLIGWAGLWIVFFAGRRKRIRKDTIA